MLHLPKKDHLKNNLELKQRSEINLQMQRKSPPKKLQLIQIQRKHQQKQQHQLAQQDKFATNMILKPSITKNHSMESVLMKIELDIKMSLLNQNTFQHQSIQLQILQLNSLKLIQHQLLQQKMLHQQPQLKMLLLQPQLRPLQPKQLLQRLPLQRKKMAHNLINQDPKTKMQTKVQQLKILLTQL